MVATIGIFVSLAAPIPAHTASDVVSQRGDSVHASSALAIAVIPTLILASTLVLSLEILDQSRVSRPLSVGILVFLWASCLDDDIQLFSLLFAALCHGVQEAFTRLKNGDATMFRPQSSISSLWHYWIRVFSWAATLACASALAYPTADKLGDWHLVTGVISTAFYFAIYCECTEILLLLYYSSKPIAYRWRDRAPLWLTFGLLGELYSTRMLSSIGARIYERCRPATAALVVVALQTVASQVDWTVVLVFVRRRWAGLTTMVHKKKPAHSVRRRSFLYRTGSDVEVVGMAIHYQTYDLRHNPNDDAETSPA